MTDRFNNHADAVDAPATRSFPVVPSDSAELATLPKALYVGNGGTLAMQGPGDEVAVTWTNIPSGALIPFRAAKVMATGTSATDIVGIA